MVHVRISKESWCRPAKPVHKNDFSWQEVTLYEASKSGFDIVFKYDDCKVTRKNNPFLHETEDVFSLKVDLGISTSEGFNALILGDYLQKMELDWWQDEVKLFYNYDKEFKKGDVIGRLFVVPCEVDVLPMDVHELSHRRKASEYIKSVKPTREDNRMALLVKKRKRGELPEEVLPYQTSKRRLYRRK